MIYGNMLNFFQEQFRQFDYFSMQALPRSSYKTRVELGKVKGIVQYMKKGDLHEENDTLSLEETPTLWTRQTIKTGNFIKKGDDIFRIRKPADWTFEGGFNVYILESVVGVTDTQQPFSDVNLGQNDYD